MNNFHGFRCSICKAEYSQNAITYTCPKDGGNLDVVLNDVTINRQTTIKDITTSGIFSIWRYLPLLPVNDPGFNGTPLHSVGWTPCYPLTRMAGQLGLEQFWVKDDGRNPTASYKDRASAVVIVHAKEINVEVVVTASTGNAGAALAGMAAAAQHKSVIIVPKTAPPAKVAQLLIFGASVLLVEGNYDQAFDLSIQAANEFGWYCRNTGYNPYTLEGKKTAAYEIWEQVLLQNKLKKPLCVFVSVGDGNIISSLHKGFKDLNQLGWLEQMPRIFGVQSEGSAAIANAFNSGTETIVPVNAHTLADSISVDLPRDGLRAVRAVTETFGQYITVTDQAILEAIAELGREGIFVEPAASTALSGLKKAIQKEIIKKDDPVLVMLTGSGLKDIKAAVQAVKEAPIIEPTLNAIKKVLNLI